MSGRNKAARVLVTLGAILLIGGALLHCGAAYPKISSALRGAHLDATLEGALRAVFLMVGWDWIVVAVIALVAAFTATRIRKVIVVLCGFDLLVTMLAMLTLIGWFIGTILILASALMILCGGLLFENAAE
jgi:hypothetical protein